MAKQIDVLEIPTSELRVLAAVARCQEYLSPINPTYREYAAEADVNVSWVYRAIASLEKSWGLVARPRKTEGEKAPYRGRIVITKRGQQVLEVVKRKSA